MNAAQLFVKSLEAEGVKYIFGLPGEENLLFLDAIRESSIELIVTRHEQAAVFMAATMGRLTGKVGVALSTLGPGATNLVTGVAYAQLGGMPLIVITGQKPIRKSKQGRFQIIDVVRMMEPLTKMATTIVSGERVASLVREAVKLAEAERPGVVHLEFPEDIAAEEVTSTPLLPQKIRRPGPDPKAILLAVQALERAKHPLIVIAAGANRKLVRKHLRALIEKTGIPFVATQMGKGVEDERSPLYIGTTALSAGDYVHETFRKADLILMVGHDITEKPPMLLDSTVREVIHVNFYQADVDEVYHPTLEVLGDIAHTLWAITEQITPQSHWDHTAFLSLRAALLAHIEESASIATFPLRPERLVADLRSVLKEQDILSLDNGMYKIWVARNYPAYEQNTVLLDNALATMGAGLPAGIAAKMLYPDRNVLVVAGDGGIMMNISELETATRLGLDLVVLILNDSGYGMIQWKQTEMNLPSYGLGFTNPDFVGLATSFGATGHRIGSTEELVPTLQKAFAAKGVHVIDCPVDYSQNGVGLGAELRERIKKTI
ncbi:acetolactate synthase large subunit [Patescibacteria group bacterium]|nr:acetolactate synthase large subunit [Patescibacteria group bacterium]